MGCGGEEDTTAFGAPNATSNATLTWNAPLTRTDGTPLPVSEIGGYRVYMGADANNLSLIADISTPYVMKYEVKNLKAGRYYFSITTYDKRHIESDLSNIVDKKI